MQWEYFTTQLEELGYFRYASATKKQHMDKFLQHLRNTHILFGSGVNRDFPADEERLTECGVKNFLKIIKPMLAANNVRWHKVDEACSHTGYTVRIDGRPFVMYTMADLERNADYVWGLTTRRSFSMINTLLKEANTDERIFSLYGGNDHLAVFLTNKLYKLILDSEWIAEGRVLVRYEDPEC